MDASGATTTVRMSNISRSLAAATAAAAAVALPSYGLNISSKDGSGRYVYDLDERKAFSKLPKVLGKVEEKSQGKSWESRGKVVETLS